MPRTIEEVHQLGQHATYPRKRCPLCRTQESRGETNNEANMNRYEQAVQGLRIGRGNGVVRVSDGAYTWLCWEAAWDRARHALEFMAPVADELKGSRLDTAEAGAQAYADLCGAVKGTLLETSGSGDRGTEDEQRALARAAQDADLLLPCWQGLVGEVA